MASSPPPGEPLFLMTAMTTMHNLATAPVIVVVIVIIPIPILILLLFEYFDSNSMIWWRWRCWRQWHCWIEIAELKLLNSKLLNLFYWIKNCWIRFAELKIAEFILLNSNKFSNFFLTSQNSAIFKNRKHACTRIQVFF